MPEASMKGSEPSTNKCIRLTARQTFDSTGVILGVVHVIHGRSLMSGVGM